MQINCGFPEIEKPILEKMLMLSVVLLLGIPHGYVYCRTPITKESNADITEFPFMASIRDSNSAHHICGGTIVNPEWILTTAHCVRERLPSKLYVQHGASELSSTTHEKVISVSKFVIHPDYDDVTRENNLGLVKLEGSIDFNEFSKPVKFPPEGASPLEGSPAVHVKWLKHGHDHAEINRLQKINITFSDESCSRSDIDKVYTNNICGKLASDHENCLGDEGSPMIYENQQIGIFSLGHKRCHYATYPAIYVEVIHYLDWIYENTNDLEFSIISDLNSE